jgi:hypothetical protein
LFRPYRCSKTVFFLCAVYFAFGLWLPVIVIGTIGYFFTAIYWNRERAANKQKAAALNTNSSSSGTIAPSDSSSTTLADKSTIVPLLGATDTYSSNDTPEQEDISNTDAAFKVFFEFLLLRSIAATYVNAGLSMLIAFVTAAAAAPSIGEIKAR